MPRGKAVGRQVGSQATKHTDLRVSNNVVAGGDFVVPISMVVHEVGFVVQPAAHVLQPGRYVVGVDDDGNVSLGLPCEPLPDHAVLEEEHVL